MRRSKLEIYIDILDVLACKGPLKVTHIMCKSNLNFANLRVLLDFLVENNLVEMRSPRAEQIVYGITPRGKSVLKAFRVVQQVFDDPKEKEFPISLLNVYSRKASSRLELIGNLVIGL